MILRFEEHKGKDLPSKRNIIPERQSRHRLNLQTASAHPKDYILDSMAAEYAG